MDQLSWLCHHGEKKKMVSKKILQKRNQMIMTIVLSIKFEGGWQI